MISGTHRSGSGLAHHTQGRDPQADLEGVGGGVEVAACEGLLPMLRDWAAA